MMKKGWLQKSWLNFPPTSRSGGLLPSWVWEGWKQPLSYLRTHSLNKALIHKSTGPLHQHATSREVTHLGCSPACFLNEKASHILTLRCCFFCGVVPVSPPCFSSSSNCLDVPGYSIIGVKQLFHTENSSLPCVCVFYKWRNKWKK